MIPESSGTTLLHFLRRELAPVPGRLRASLRILVGCLVALLLTVVIGGGAMPHGHWVIASIFTVSLADAGASLRKGLQRLAGTVVGGLAGILAVIALPDLPVFYVPLLGAVGALGVFASLTTTAPYVMLLGTLTFVLVTFVPPGAVTSAVETGLWRIPAIALGVACGTLAQIVLWPDDPEAKLREVFAARLRRVASVIAELARSRDPDPGISNATTAVLARDDLTVQLDLLANAEARHPSLRERHTEQLALIVEIDRLMTTAVWLADAARQWGPFGGETRGPLDTIAREASTLAAALTTGRPPADPPDRKLVAPRITGSAPGLEPTLADMRLALQRTRRALSFLDDDRRIIAPALDRPPHPPLFTPAFSTKNTAAVALALKAGLGLVISYVLMHALDWPALLTAGVTAVVVSQTTFGATIQKSMLRLAGATLGGAVGMATIVVAMPNIDSIGALLLAAAPGLWIAAWITAGSSLISYVGFQTGMAFAMCVTDPAGPTIDLVTGRDRVLGIIFGVLVMVFLDAVFRPVRARRDMWSALARALRALAALSRLAPETRGYSSQLQRAVRSRSGIYQELGATLRLTGEAALEPDARESQAERERVTQLTLHVQSVFLAVLALIRHRLAPDFPTLSGPMQDAMRGIDAAVGEMLEKLAERLEGGQPGPLPDLEQRLAAYEALIPVGTSEATEAAVRDHGAIARDLIHQIDQLRQSMDGGRTPWTKDPGQGHLVQRPA